MKFVSSTIIYAYFQAVDVLNAYGKTVADALAKRKLIYEPIKAWRPLYKAFPQPEEKTQR